MTPQDLLQQAMTELRLPLPVIVTAPPRGADGMVGLAQWFWLDPGQRAPRTRRVSAGPVWAELTASPQQLTIEPGAGLARVSCPGGGAAYGTAASSASVCTSTYARSSAGQPGGRYTVTATVMWGGKWRGSGGQGGPLPPIPQTSRFTVRIGEGQALNGAGR